MDSRDLRLIARLSREPLGTQAALAQDAGLSANAARARIAKLRASGVLMGVYAFPNPALFGKATRIAVYAPPMQKMKPADTLDIDAVLSYSVNHDGQIAVTYYADGPTGPPPPALDRLMGAPAPRVYVRESPPMRPPGAVLSRDQWRIVEAMLDDGRASARDLAEATGLSERVVRRQRERLLAGSQVTLVTGILSNLAEGIVLFHLFVAGPGTKDAAAVERAIGAAIVQERTRDPDGLYIFCSADSLGDALVARERAAAIPGVEHVELVLEREAGVATERIKSLCRERREAFTRRALDGAMAKTLPIQANKLKMKTIAFKVEVVDKMSALATAAFGLVAALAWNNAIQAIFARYYPSPAGTPAPVGPIGALLAYAGIITLIAVAVILLIGRFAGRLKAEADEIARKTDATNAPVA